MDRYEPDYEEDGSVLLGWIAAAVVLALVLMFTFTRGGNAEPVTAAVTTDGGTVLAKPVQEFQVVLTNKVTGRDHPWTGAVWEHQFLCDKAIEGIQGALDAIADPDPAHVVVRPADADQRLVKSVAEVVAFILANTGRAPVLAIRCEKKPYEGI